MNPALVAMASSAKKFRRVPTGQTAPDTSIYDLYGTDTNARGTIPFTVTWPTAPTGTLTPLTVTNNTQLATALATPSAQITVAAGSYNALTLAEDDQDWIIDDGATFSGFGGTGFARVRVTGGNVVTAGDVSPYGFTDLLMRNINIECQSLNIGLGSTMFSRAAMVHCTVYATRVGLITPGASASDVGVRGYDLILAANYVSGGMLASDPGVEPAFRIQSVERCILVDNRARCGFENGGGGVVDTKHTYRSHYGNQDYWGRRNMTEWGDGVYWQARANNDTVLANNRMGRHWWYDFDMYTERLSAYAFRGAGGGTVAADWLQPIVVDGNRGFTNVTANDNWTWAGKSGDTIGTNTTAAYQAPPALGSWLAADGTAPGADH